MNFQVTKFNMIIPLKFNKQEFDKIKTYYLNKKSCEEIIYPFKSSILKMTALEGSRLIDEQNPLVCRFKLERSNQVNIQLGLNGKRNYIYHIGNKEKISFCIEDIYLWFYETGIAFLTVEIETKEEKKENILELYALLNDLKVKSGDKKSQIVFQKSVKQEDGTYTKEDRTFFMREILHSLLELPGWVSLSLIDDTLNNAMNQNKYNLFYGVIDDDENGELPLFLEMLHLKRRRHLKLDEKENLSGKVCFKGNYNHVEWNISKNMISAIGNLKKAECQENIDFLLEEGGLKKSIFHNYLAIYLYYLSFDLQLKALDSPNILEQELPTEQLKELQPLLDFPLKELSTQADGFEHIQKLFEEYLDAQVLNISEKMKKLATLIQDKFVVLKDDENEQSTGQLWEKGTYVFISYSSKDEEKVNDVCRILEKNNIVYWKASHKSIQAGNDFAEKIVEAVTNSGCVLLLLTKNSQESPHARREIGIAVDERKEILTLQLEDMQINGSFRYLIQTAKEITYVPELNENGEDLQDLICKIKEYTS